MIVGLVVAAWFASGFYLVGPAEKAVVTRFGRFDRITGEGPNVRLPWPIESKQLVNTQEVLSFTDRTRMLTVDQALVVINIAVQYRRSDPQAFVFNIVDPQLTLGEVSESAIREIVGQNKLDFVLEQGRQQIAVRTKQLIQKTLDSYKSGLEVIGVNLQDVSVPEQVAPSQKDAIKAREDKDRLRVEARAARPSGSCWTRRRTGSGSSPTRKARARASRSSRPPTRRHRASPASGSTSRRWRPCSATPARCSSIPRAMATCCTCRWTSCSTGRPPTDRSRR